MASVIPSVPLGAEAAADRSDLGADAEAAGQAAAERRFRFELAAHPGSPAQARRLTRDRLSGWSVCADTCDTAVLVISELVTNAIVHTASRRVVCELHDHDGILHIAVHDEGCAPGVPHPSPRRAEEEHGRGLLLVEAMCHAWGAQEHGPGLLVWAELPCRTETDTALNTPGSRNHPGRNDPGLAEPRGDLGWGARPQPGTARGPGEEEPVRKQYRRTSETEARQSVRREWL